MNDFLYYAEWHFDDGTPYYQLYNTKKQALIHAKKMSLNKKFGGPIKIYQRDIKNNKFSIVAQFIDGQKREKATK